MKKLIAISVVFALITGGVFAADLSAEVFGGVNLLQGSTYKGDDDVTGSGSLYRARIQGGGGDDEFGAWYRWDGGANAFVWWKPIDQFKMTIGGNPDGFYGKEGVTGWNFNQMAYDVGIDDSSAFIWGAATPPDLTDATKYPGGITDPKYIKDLDDFFKSTNTTGATYRDAFYGGFGGRALMLDIYPVDMATITIILPYFAGGEVATIFKNITAQVDVQLEGIGSFAITFDNSFTAGGPGGKDNMNSRLYAYFNLTSIENMSLDLGVSLGFGDNKDQPIGAGVGLKYDISDEFGIKFRAMGKFANEDDSMQVLADVNPYYAISDSAKVFFDVGLAMNMPKSGDSEIGFHVNPYIQVGQEWGPAFWAGFKLYNNGQKDAGMVWAVPIGLTVAF